MTRHDDAGARPADRWQLVVTGMPGVELPFLQCLRLVGRMSLRDAVAIRAYARTALATVVVAGIDRATGEHLRRAFAEAGVAVAMQPSTLPPPMVCNPLANRRYRWAGFRRIDDGER